LEVKISSGCAEVEESLRRFTLPTAARSPFQTEPHHSPLTSDGISIDSLGQPVLQSHRPCRTTLVTTVTIIAKESKFHPVKPDRNKRTTPIEAQQPKTRPDSAFEFLGYCEH
jgi:hypothetical protein